MPFLVDVSGAGLGIVATWNPNPAAEKVGKYGLQATPVTTSPAAGCTPKAVLATAPSSDSRLVIGGVCAQVAYTVRIRAASATGTSALSPASSPVVPLAARPTSAPVITSLVSRDKQVVVSWTAPTDGGGAAVTGYTVAAKTAGQPTVKVKATGSATTAILMGLTNGSAYAITVTATNRVGPSQPASGAATPRAAYVPTAPAGVTATPDGSGNITVTWAAPSDDGGAVVTGYIIGWQQNTYSDTTGWTATAGSAVHTRTATGRNLTLTVTDFEAPTAFYAVTVTATNAVGDGATASTAAPVTPKVTTISAAVVLSDATLAALSRVTSTSLSWNVATTSQVSKLKVNQILVAGLSTATPNGFIRKVVAVTRDGDSYTATTTDSPLSSVIANGALAAATNPVSADAPGGTAGGLAATPRFQPSLPGIQVRPNASVGYSASTTFGINTKIGAVKITGGLTVNPSISLDINFAKNAVGLPNGVRVTATAKVTTTAQLVATLAGDFEKKIGELDGAPIKFSIGPVPVVVVPRMPIYLSGEGNVSVGTSATMTIGTQLDWTSTDSDKLKTRNISTPLTLTGGAIPGLIRTASGSLSLKFQPIAALYGIGGPSFGAELKLAAELNANPSPGDNFLTVTATLTLSAGLAIDILKFHGDRSYHAPTITLKTFKITKVPNASWAVSPSDATVNVGDALQLTASRSDDATPGVTWHILGGVAGDTISDTGVLHPSAPSGRSLTVIVSDASGASGQTDVTVGAAFDAPGDFAGTANPDGSTTVSWSEPLNAGGAPLSSYALLTTPDTGVKTVPAGNTSATLAGVSVGSYVTIYAFNTANVRSPGATTAVNVEQVVPAGSDGWSSLQQPAGSTSVGYFATSFDDSSWTVGPAGFGAGGCPFNATERSPWDEGQDLYLRRHFSMPAGTVSIHISGTIDNYAQIYLNGAEVGSFSGGDCETDTISVDVPASALGVDNVLAVAAEDDGVGSRYVDVSIAASV